MISDKERYEYIIEVIAKDAILKKWQMEDLKRRLEKAEKHLDK